MGLFRGRVAIRFLAIAVLLSLGFLSLLWLTDHPTALGPPGPHTVIPVNDPLAVPQSIIPEQQPPTYASRPQPPYVPPPPGTSLNQLETPLGEDQEIMRNDAGWRRVPKECPDYTMYSRQTQAPQSLGKLTLSFQRPRGECRTFESPAVEAEIERMKGIILDLDLFRIFENTFPSTLDTCIRWMGVAEDNAEEELAFIITGDINAMWLRDSANQLQVYRDLIKDKNDGLAALFRGAINLQARYIITAPYCNAFQAPKEAGIPVHIGGSGSTVTPFFDPHIVETCNFELDSFGAFLQLSEDYLQATGDVEFFGKFKWLVALKTIVQTATDMTASTYDEDGKPRIPTYKFNSRTTTMTGTLNNVGQGNPVKYTGMVRSPFRPSDDTAVYEFLVPANMMFARYLETAANITKRMAQEELTGKVEGLAKGIRKGIEEFAIVEGPGGMGKIYAYEVDGFGGRNFMDDANVPSLLSAPFLGYVDQDDPVYLNTRKFVLSKRNPWWCEGPAISGVGGPHIKPGAAWPMSGAVRMMTTDDEVEIEKTLVELVKSTAGTGLMHESVNSYSVRDYTRPWFSWANGLFAQAVLDLSKRKPGLITKSYQDVLSA